MKVNRNPPTFESVVIVIDTPTELARLRTILSNAIADHGLGEVPRAMATDLYKALPVA